MVAYVTSVLPIGLWDGDIVSVSLGGEPDFSLPLDVGSEVCREFFLSRNLALCLLDNAPLALDPDTGPRDVDNSFVFLS